MAASAISMLPTTQKWSFFGSGDATADAVANHLETMRRALESAESSPNPQIRRTARIRYLGTLGTLVAACPSLCLAPPHQLGYTLRETLSSPQAAFTSLLSELIWLGYWLVDDSATDAGDRNGLAWVGSYLLQNEAEIDTLLPEAVNALGFPDVPQTSYSISQFGILLAWARELQQCAPEQLQFAEIARFDAEQKRLLPDSSILQHITAQLFAIVYQRRARELAATCGALPAPTGPAVGARSVYAAGSLPQALLEACVLYYAAGNAKASEDLQYRAWDASKRELQLDTDEWESAKLNAHTLAREYMRPVATAAPSLLPSSIPRAPMGDHARWYELCAQLGASRGATHDASTPLREAPTPIQIMTAAALLVDSSKLNAEGKKWLQNWFWTHLNWDADTDASSWTTETQKWTSRINAAATAATRVSFGDRIKTWLSARTVASTREAAPASAPIFTVIPQAQELPQALDDDAHAEMALQWALRGGASTRFAKQ